MAAVKTELKQTRDEQNFSVDFRVVPEAKINKVCSELGVEYKANGCSTFNPKINLCTIYVVPITDVDDTKHLAVIGHELWHCRYGEFHE